ncbi:MAG: ORF6C domain-containing protein [Clostridia bacterium]|nr:ORF6C domain-containing protein [Clostridia bacterium]
MTDHEFPVQTEEVNGKRGISVPGITEQQAINQFIATTIQAMMAPVMRNIGEILERNNQAMERIAATQQMMSQRISDLEKQVRLKTPLSRAQERYINDTIRARARELLEAKGFAEDKKAVSKLGGHIRKSVLARYGVDSLREAPAYDYETALDQVKCWYDPLVIRDVVKEAREREERCI